MAYGLKASSCDPLKLLLLILFFFQKFLNFLVYLDESLKWVVVVLRSPIHANEPSEYNGMLYRTSNRVLNNGIKVIILICMDGTSQYHHYPKRSGEFFPRCNDTCMNPAPQKKKKKNLAKLSHFF